MAETPEIRLKRLKMRSWRRGMKEMDLILGPFSDGRLAELSLAELETYEEMLDENDQEIYTWFSAQIAPPAHYKALIEKISTGMSFVK
jgi:antitoxin CptB